VTHRRDDLDLGDTLYLVRDNLGKADAFITAMEALIEESWGGVGDDDADDRGDDEPGRRRNNVAHLVESAKLAVRAAIDAGDQMATKLDKHRVESERSVVVATAPNKHRVRT